MRREDDDDSPCLERMFQPLVLILQTLDQALLAIPSLPNVQSSFGSRKRASAWIGGRVARDS